MWNDEARGKMASRGTLRRLRSDTGGNTLAIMAAAMIPMAALVGSGVDTARTYVVKSRLQQACDAGVLAGRKAMQPSASTTLETVAAEQATAFFDNNFERGWLGTSNVTFVPSKTADQQVLGVASATVPMTIMRMFDANDVTLTVTCEARYDVADSDIMFVLDVTGSMACRPESDCTPGNTSYNDNGVTRFAAVELAGSRMQALREAVVDFESTVRTNADASTRIRYGFVPYASSVNAGAAIPAAHMVRTTHSYNSRRIIGDTQISSSTVTRSGYNSTNCATSANGRVPATGYNSDGTATSYTDAFWDAPNTRCRATQRNLRATWRFEPIEFDVSGYYGTLAAGTTIADPTRLDGRRTAWQGCIEERNTTTATSFDIANLPPDLNPDLIPTNDATRWRPAWPDITWGRNGNTAVNSAETDAWFEARSLWSPYNGALRQPGGFAACPPPVRRLSAMTAAQVSAYVNAPSFRPHGGTYHDAGMIWGVRLLSPNGIFAADTAPLPGRPSPRRHIVYMTDGQLAPNADIYGLYGIQRYDNRVGGGAGLAAMEARHAARFRAVCQYARERLNITIWVVAFSTGLNDDLRDCATPGNHAFTAGNKAELQAAFRQIAQQVAMLRIDR
ncbi:pilus assembly protein TadG-related protein [Sphingomonas aestuarii]